MTAGWSTSLPPLSLVDNRNNSRTGIILTKFCLSPSCSIISSISDSSTHSHRNSSGYDTDDSLPVVKPDVKTTAQEHYDHLANLDYCQKRYVDSMTIFHAEFELIFNRPMGQNNEPARRWFLVPVDEGMYLPADSRCIVELAKVRFICDRCAHMWTSMRSQATFFYRHPNDLEGELFFMLARQRCAKCDLTTSPLWYADEICRVVHNVFGKVCCDGKNVVSELRSKRVGMVNGRHLREKCEACAAGTCASPMVTQLKFERSGAMHESPSPSIEQSRLKNNAASQ